ncbi:hypothetical protein BDR06DRAFT_983288 [Suillus hirtellus]|nr:hypothetical protein BDR06DRAFT_983288 [Suillus hirtellus]
MVCAFHGHTHNQQCQIDWHPMYIEGTGHTEGEGCEHVFSSLNELACSTCHTTPFHQHQTIDQTLTAELSSLKGVLNLTHADFVHFHEVECSYLDGLKEPPVKDHVSIQYVQALDQVVNCHFQEMHIAINQAQIQVDGAYSKLQNAEAMASCLEI